MDASRRKLPEVLLVDSSIAGSGMELPRAIRQQFPAIKICVLTSARCPKELVREMRASMQNGARGYVLKTTSGPQLVSIVRQIHSGQRWVPGEIAGEAFGDTHESAAVPATVAGRDNLEALTPREEAIIAKVGTGMTNAEIAETLGITEKTVKHYMTNIIQKYGVANRMQAWLEHQRRKGVRKAS